MFIKFFFLGLLFNRLHFMASTNAGMCQDNMSWYYEVRGANYHWVADLYEQLNLLVLPAVVQALQKPVDEKAATLQKEKTEEAKANRVQESRQARRPEVQKKMVEEKSHQAHLWAR